jgi:hypothetical protein
VFFFKQVGDRGPRRLVLRLVEQLAGVVKIDDAVLVVGGPTAGAGGNVVRGRTRGSARQGSRLSEGAAHRPRDEGF